jgi:hypothetical protein
MSGVISLVHAVTNGVLMQAESQPRATDQALRADPPPYPGTPRWVKVSGFVAGVLVLLVSILFYTAVGGPHGPGRHMQSGVGWYAPFIR